MSRKAHYSTTAPLCAVCHRNYDDRLDPFDLPGPREAVQRVAAEIEAEWQALNQRSATA